MLVTFAAWEYAGLGVGYRNFLVDVEHDGSTLDGEFEFYFYGPTVFAVFSF